MSDDLVLNGCCSHCILDANGRKENHGVINIKFGSGKLDITELTLGLKLNHTNRDVEHELSMYKGVSGTALISKLLMIFWSLHIVSLLGYCISGTLWE